MNKKLNRRMLLTSETITNKKWISPKAFVLRQKQINQALKDASTIATGIVPTLLMNCKALINHRSHRVIMFYNSEINASIIAKGYVDEYIEKFEGTTVYLVDLSKEKPELVLEFLDEYKIKGIPTLCLARNGEIESKIDYLNSSDNLKVKDVEYIHFMESEVTKLKEWLDEYLFVY